MRAAEERKKKPLNRLQVAGWITIGVGVIALGAGTTLGLVSSASGDNAAERCENDLCLKSAKSDIEQEKDFAIAADVTMGIGAAAIATGAALLIYNAVKGGGKEQPASSAEEVWLRPAILPSGAGAALGGSF